MRQDVHQDPRSVAAVAQAVSQRLMQSGVTSTFVAPAPRFSRLAAQVNSHEPQPGQHTRQILYSILGQTEQQVTELISCGAIEQLPSPKL